MTIYDRLSEWAPDRMSPAQRRAYISALMGLANGTLQPLAKYLRDGWPIGGLLALELLAMIEDDPAGITIPLFEITIKGRAGNKRSWAKMMDAHRLKIRIGYFMDELINMGATVDVAAADAEKKFGCKRRTLDNARSYYVGIRDGRIYDPAGDTGPSSIAALI